MRDLGKRVLLAKKKSACSNKYTRKYKETETLYSKFLACMLNHTQTDLKTET